MNVKQWIKKLRYIVANYDRDHSWFNARMNEATALIKERTDIHADVAFHAKGQSQIIMIGRYARNDYIQIFTVGEGDFNYLVTQMREMQRYGTIKKVDCAASMRDS